MSREEPLVSVITPVYNGESYLAECIDSVLAQTYSSWEYVIVNNCSTDGTLEIAERYARLDKRIHVYSNEVLLDIIENHNRAFRLLSAQSKYCKIVSADDCLFPNASPVWSTSPRGIVVGIVGSYQLSGNIVGNRRSRVSKGWGPHPRTMSPLLEIGRTQLLSGSI